MEALARPPRRREASSATLSRKLSSGNSFSASAKHAYDGVFAAPKHGPSSRSSGIDDYGEIFGGSRGSSIPVLDLPSLDESEVLASRRSSKLDYSNIFGGFCNDGVALSYEQLFEKLSGAKNLPEAPRAAAKGASSSSSPERLEKMKISKQNQQSSIEEASSEPVDGMKQFNMSYHKTSQRNIEIKNGTTHIAQMHSTPGYTCFIDESSSPPKETVSDEKYPEISQSRPVQSKSSPLSNLGANLVDNRRQHKRSVTTDFKEVPKRNSSKDGFTDFSSSLSDEEVDLNATAAASVAALRKALETAQASIRIAKEIMERKGGAQRFEVKKKREEKIPSGGNNKFLGNISKDILKNGDVSEKDKAKQCDKFVRENENYKLGSAREHEAASLNNQETNKRTKEIPTTDQILGQPNTNKNSLEEACKVVEVRNTPQDAVNEHLKSDNYIDNRPVAATHKIHELVDNNKAGIYLKDEKLKDEHKLETEESDNKRVCEVEMARQLPDAVKSPDNKSIASYNIREEDKTDNAEVSQDDRKMDKQENSPIKCEPEINLCLPTEESVKVRDCEVEITKWVPNGSEIYSTGSSLIATYEVHEMEGVPLNEEKMEDKQEPSFGPGRCEAEINAYLLLTEESNERKIIQAANKIEKNEKLPSEEEGCKKICEDPPESEEMNNMTVPQADKESEEIKEDFSRQEEYKESVEIEESEQFVDEEVKSASNQMPKEIFTPEISEKENIAMDSKDEDVKPASDQMPKEIFTPDIIEKETIAMDSKDEETKPAIVPKEIFTPEILEKENIAMDSKDGIDDVDLHESRLKATCELKGVWKNRYLSSWWGAISEAISKESTDNEKDNNNEHESKSTGAGSLKGVWKSRYLASEWGVNKEAFDVESKKNENNEIENGLENKLKGTTCELKGVWKTRYLASDWGAIKDSPVKEAEEVCQEEENMNNQNKLRKEYDAEESETSAGDESDDVDESESLFAKIHKFKETEISHGDGDHKVSTEIENLDNAPDAFANHLKAFQSENSSEKNGSVSNVANESVDQDNLEAAAKMEDRVNETYCCEEAEIQGKMDDGPQKIAFDDKQEESSIKNQTMQNEDDSDFSSSSRDDKSYESFSEDKETSSKVEESKENQKLLGIDGNKTKHGDEAKKLKEGKEEHVRRTAEMDQKNRDRIVVERAIREARERAFTEARERAERAAVERATAEVRQRAMAEAREKVEKAAAASSKSLASKSSVEARLRAERAAVERATSEARERAREKAALSQKATSSREPAANNDQQGSDGNNGESAQRCKARQERHQRTMERAAKALAEKNQRDLKSQKEQAERNRFAETLDAEVKRWSSGKEGNLRALLSTLQYILGPDSGWQPVSLTEIITTAAVKKSYRRANLHVHPDKLQQRGATIQQKYICEKVFDLLKAAWNKFNSEER